MVNEQTEEIKKYFSGFCVSSDRLKEIIFDMAPDCKFLIWKWLCDKNVVQGELADSFFLGYEIVQLEKVYPLYANQIIAVRNYCHDMNNLPLISIKGKLVDGKEIRFR